MHCGRSLARVGLDFRGPVAACVARAAHGLFRNHIARAVAMLSSSIDMHKWAPMPAARVTALEAGGGGPAATALSDATPLLMQHPPLAVFVNAVRTPAPAPIASPPACVPAPPHRTQPPSLRCRSSSHSTRCAASPSPASRPRARTTFRKPSGTARRCWRTCRPRANCPRPSAPCTWPPAAACMRRCARSS